jgi:hypothetical protein
MMISSKESCGTDLPSMAGTRRNTMFSQGFYNPPYQISGQHYMAGTIAKSGPASVTLDSEAPLEIFVGKMNIRESPSLTGAKTGKVTEVNSAYGVDAKSWETVGTTENMKVGDRNRLWALLTDDKGELLGWACTQEYIKIAEPAQAIKIAYGIKAKKDESKLDEATYKKYEDDKKSEIAAMDKWLAANKPKSSGGSKDKTTDAKAGSEDTGHGGLSTTSMVLIGLGAAALVYFLIQKGKK